MKPANELREIARGVHNGDVEKRLLVIADKLDALCCCNLEMEAYWRCVTCGALRGVEDNEDIIHPDGHRPKKNKAEDSCKCLDVNIDPYGGSSG